MKNRFIPLLLILGASLLGFFGCNLQTKYEEGPFVSIFPARDRVVNEWEWAYALEYDVNRTGILADSTIEFLDDGVVKICRISGECREGTWNLITKRSKLQIVFGSKATAYDIFMLKENEMWVRLSENDTFVVEWELVSKK